MQSWYQPPRKDREALMKANQAAFDTGQLAERMAQGYYMHSAAVHVATDPRAMNLAPATTPGHIVPVSSVARKDGTQHVFHFTHFLSQARDNPALADDLGRVWLVGSLLSVGDALGDNDYFDRAPELELMRHLRNGIAHGNKFRIDKPASLAKFPAHNRLAWIRSDNQSVFEISANLQGQPVLYDFMGPGDVLDLLMSIGLYLVRMGNGDPLRLP
jgi:hypothetical protein